MTTHDRPVRRSDTRAKMELVLAAMWELPSNGKTVTASVREIQKLTGLGRGTVSKALQRCAEDGWIIPTGNAKRSPNWRTANSFRLIRESTAPPSFLLSRNGLGVTSFLIWLHVNEDEWSTTDALAVATQMSTKTAKQYLLRLHSVGLVDRHRDQWIRIASSDELNSLEDRYMGDHKRIFVRHVTEEQVVWKKTVHQMNLWRYTRGHTSGR